MSRTLHVTQTSVREIAQQWKWDPVELASYLRTALGPVYVRCTRKGHINWDKAPIYKVDELIGRNNVRILNRDGTYLHKQRTRT